MKAFYFKKVVDKTCNAVVIVVAKMFQNIFFL